jgi:hypothetical protein
MWLREDGTPYYVGKDSSGQRNLVSQGCDLCAL